MATNWIIWGVAIAISFAVLETLAFVYPAKQWTLSKSMAYLGSNWPWTIIVSSALAGGALTHFFWHFCP